MAVITPTPPKERQPGPMEPGRICAHADCETRLSTYNQSETCSVHAGWQTGRVRSATSIGDLLDLLTEERCD